MRPIRLHLDSSDYASMYRAQAGSPEAHVRDALEKFKESGSIEIGMSYHVVFELLQKADPKYRDDRIARARFLSQLCGKNAFPYPSDLGQGYRFSTDGLWVPRIDLDEIEIERLVQIVMEKFAQHSELSRRERRALSKRNYFVEWVRDNPVESRRLITEHWPLLFGRDFAENGDFRRYMLGEIGRRDANSRLRFYITDPATAYETWYESYGKDNPVPERRDPMAEKLMAMLNELNAILDEEAKLKTKIKETLSISGEDALDPSDREALKGLSRKADTFRLEITSPEELRKHPAWIKLVGEEAALIAAQIFYAFHREKRNIKPSDAIDLIHAMYLPHTDLWRGDKAFSNLLIKNQVMLHERIVPSLTELPSRLEIEIGRRRA